MISVDEHVRRKKEATRGRNSLSMRHGLRSLLTNNKEEEECVISTDGPKKQDYEVDTRLDT